MFNSLLWLCYKKEMLVMHKVFFIGQYIFLSLLFNIISLAFIMDSNNIGKISLILPISFIPIVILSSSSSLIKRDIEDGTMTILLTTLEPYYIVLSKFMALFSIALIATISIMPILWLIYSHEIIKMLQIIIAQIFLIIQTSAFAILISSISGYFRSNTSFLISIILPILIPSIISSGLLLKDFNQQHLAISLGLVFITIPLCIIFSSYLVKNLYNF